jgi:hypothetical protein
MKLQCAHCSIPLVPGVSHSHGQGDYRSVECPNCRRNRVQRDGVCEKCLWDVDGNDYACVTRPSEYNAQGYIFVQPDENPILS